MVRPGATPIQTLIHLPGLPAPMRGGKAWRAVVGTQMGQNTQLSATRLLRRLRGGSQAHLLEADDGQAYVTKFKENPQHRRVLINEWIGAALFRAIGVVAPRVRAIRISAEFLAAYPELCLMLENGRTVPAPGTHLAISTPGPLDQLGIFDYVPDPVLRGVSNREHFAAALALDKWASHTDARQAVFFRSEVRRHWSEAPYAPNARAFVASMIDHGYLFDGPAWEFTDGPLQGLYPRRVVYDGIQSVEDFEPWLGRIHALPESMIGELVDSVPEEWMEGDRDALTRLLEGLWRRKRRLEDLLAYTLRVSRHFQSTN